MPRDSPSNTEYAHKIIGSLKTLFQGLPPTIAYISIFKKYSEYILNQRSAIYQATQFLPILAALIVIQVERDLDHAHEMTEIRKEMDQLRREIKSLTSHD